MNYATGSVGFVINGGLPNVKALSVDGKIEMPLQEMFWGGYFGSLTDNFGIRWMFNCANKT
jgi:uncharacterized glyoxalase superfamily protein PhnB